MKIVEDAVERLFSNLKMAHGFHYTAEDDHGYWGKPPYAADIERIRMDYEADGDTTEDNVDEKSVREVRAFITKDLNDLIENGDKDKKDDFWLKIVDGTKKRGTEPELVDIFCIDIRKRYVRGKDSTEYTIHFLLATRWPDEEEG